MFADGCLPGEQGGRRAGSARERPELVAHHRDIATVMGLALAGNMDGRIVNVTDDAPVYEMTLIAGVSIPGSAERWTIPGRAGWMVRWSVRSVSARPCRPSTLQHLTGCCDVHRGRLVVVPLTDVHPAPRTTYSAAVLATAGPLVQRIRKRRSSVVRDWPCVQSRSAEVARSAFVRTALGDVRLEFSDGSSRGPRAAVRWCRGHSTQRAGEGR